MHLVAFHPRERFGNRHLAQFFDEALENPPPDLRMRHLAAAEEDRRFDFIALFKEALDVLLLELVVMLVVGDREAAEGSVSVRERSGGDKGAATIDAFLTAAREEIASKGLATVTA